METLAFIHNAVAYEDPNPESELRSFEDISLKAPGSIALGVLSAGVVTATLNHADQAQALIGPGDRGPGVAQLQRKLGITDDGIFGPQTYDRLVSFQENNRLVPDGVAGPQTLPALRLDPYLGPGRYTAGRPVNRNPNVSFRSYVQTSSGIGLNIREFPTTNSRRIGSLGEGETVRLNGNTSGSWSELDGGGWIHSGYLASSSRRPINRNRTASFRPYVQTSSGIGLNIREFPTTNSRRIGSLGEGETVRLNGNTSGSWSELDGGGWIHSGYLR